ncbi:YdeI/OmpD-associated family protein, partial [Candidatus Parcubacteria bacterium]|nr:YdeI/OmpD-associated family protein [Candidatus Parcubacteria bacterium]
MVNKKISNGIVHKTPADVKKMILSKESVHEMWEDITPLARNEWICWIEDA